MSKPNDKETAELLAQIIETMIQNDQEFGSGNTQSAAVPADPLRQSNYPEGPGPCPKCGAETKRKIGRNGPFYGCVTYPNCRGTRNSGPELFGPGPCPECGSPTVPRVGGRGPFYGCSRYPACSGSRDFDLDAVLALPKPKPIAEKPTKVTVPLSPELTLTVPPLPPELLDDTDANQEDEPQQNDDCLFNDE